MPGVKPGRHLATQSALLLCTIGWLTIIGQKCTIGEMKHITEYIVPKTNDDPSYPAEFIWSAAAFAQRVNQGYFKEAQFDINDGVATKVKERNRDLLLQVLETPAQIIDQDRELGQQAQDWHRKNLMVRALQTQLSSFDQAVYKVCARETFTKRDSYDLAILASLINSYDQGVRLENARARSTGTVKRPGAIGDKVELDIEVLRCFYSTNYFVYFVTAITDQDQLVFFSYKDRLATGTRVPIRGTVKTYRDDSTQLNRVRMRS